MRIVFDTNVFVSAFGSLGDRAWEALGRIFDGEDRLLTSKPIIDELLGVLAKKFSRDPAYLARTALFLAEISNVVRPTRQLHVFADDPDNRILECAIAGGADVIVTGDRAMPKLGRYANVRIISLRAYLEFPVSTSRNNGAPSGGLVEQYANRADGHPVSALVLPRRAAKRQTHPVGLMFWLRRNRLAGSYLFFSATSRWCFSGP